MTRATTVAAANSSLAQLECWFLHAPLRFLGAGITLWILWAVAAAALASLFRVEHAVVPVLGQTAVAREAFDVLLVAPLFENTLLWLVFGAARFFAVQWLPAHVGVLAVTVSAGAFSLAHWPFKVLFGVEMLAGAWLMSMCFLWGARHRRSARGFALSVASHVGVNAVALALFHA